MNAKNWRNREFREARASFPVTAGIPVTFVMVISILLLCGDAFSEKAGPTTRQFGFGQGSPLVFSPDGGRILAGNRNLTLLDAESGERIRTFFVHSGGIVTDAAFSSDGSRVLAGVSEGGARLFDTATGESIMSLWEDKNILSVALSPDGSRALTGGYTYDLSSHTELCKIILWDTATGKGRTISISEDSDGEIPLTFSPDGSQAIGLHSGGVRVWNLATGERIISFGTDGGTCAAFSLDGARVVTGSFSHGRINLWSVATGAEIATFETRASRTLSVAISPDGSQILAGCKYEDLNTETYRGMAKLYNAETGDQITTFTGPSSGVSSVAFSPDGLWALTNNRDKVTKWNLSTYEAERDFVSIGWVVSSVAFSPDGSQVLTGSYDKTAKLWDAATGINIWTFPVGGSLGHYAGVNSVAFSPDGSRALIGSTVKDMDEHENYGTVALLNTATGEETTTFTRHFGGVLSVAFSPDGSRALTGGNEYKPGEWIYRGTARLWNTTTGEEITS